jgi:hypothetical protein
MSYIGYNKRPKITDSEGNVISSSDSLQFAFAHKKNGKIELRNEIPVVYEITPSWIPPTGDFTLKVHGCNLHANTSFFIQDFEIKLTHRIHSGLWYLTGSSSNILGNKLVIVNNGIYQEFNEMLNIKVGEDFIFTSDDWNYPDSVNIIDNGSAQLSKTDLYGYDPGFLQLPLEGDFQIDFNFFANGFSQIGKTIQPYLAEDINGLNNLLITHLQHKPGESDFSNKSTIRRYNGTLQAIDNTTGVVVNYEYKDSALFFNYKNPNDGPYIENFRIYKL